MVTVTIDNKTIQVPEDTTILRAALKAGIKIPYLCYWKKLNEIGACRVCVVEVEGYEKLFTACNNVVKDGMVIHTNSPKARAARRTNVKLILSEHNTNCTMCVRSGNCQLQEMANDLNILDIPYENKVEKQKSDLSFPLVKDETKCIKCMRCVQVCDKIQDIHVWDVVNTGGRTTVGISGAYRLKDSACTLCGQCILHCPVGALRERDDTGKVYKAIHDPEKIVVAQIAPAVRTAWGEHFDLIPEFASVERLSAALHQMGFDYVFDTDFTADLTIMEEASEFLRVIEEKKRKSEESRRISRLLKKEDGDAGESAAGMTEAVPEKAGMPEMPFFTSCCPGWIRFAKSQYPEILPHISTAKSPQQMFGAVAKSYYAKYMGVDPEKIYSVSLMPCLAKKKECELPSMVSVDGHADVDAVLTVREISRMIRAEHVTVQLLPEQELDEPLGRGSGAGMIFGATGGVMEAALRTAYSMVTGENPEPDAFRSVRGMRGWKEATFDFAGITLRVAVVDGLGNARRLMEMLKKGEVSYDFVEVMACPGGCVGGGGTPIYNGLEMAGDRAPILYKQDAKNALRFSHENPYIKKIYQEYLGEPLSETAERILHTDHIAWKMPGE